MGFSRSYKEVVSQTISVPYEASGKGGTKTVKVDIPVEINLHFDTEPFSESVKECEDTVSKLTEAVTATEAIEVKTRQDNSFRVADSIINGFFSYIRSEISQQLTEIAQAAETKQIVLKELMKRCVSLREQMNRDFQRISDRYVKIFQDLNKELSYRIFELNKSIFKYESETNNHKVRVLNNDLINIIAVFGIDCCNLLSRISSSVTKKRAYDTITKAKFFVLHQKRFNRTIQEALLNEELSGSVYSPVCFLETCSYSNQFERKLFAPEGIGRESGDMIWSDLIERISSSGSKWKKIDENEAEILKGVFYRELEKRERPFDQNSDRVKEMIKKIARFDTIYVMSKR
ncbi:hypothetical protein MASR2M69_03420 [Bacteroidota bacterium]